MKKIGLFVIFICLVIFIFFSQFASASEKVNIYFFWGEGCPHCTKEEEYLEKLKNKYSNIQILDFEIYKNPKNITLLENISQGLNMRVDGVPFVIIGEKQFVGFSEYTTPKELEKQIEYCSRYQCVDEVSKIINHSDDSGDDKLEEDNEKESLNNQEEKGNNINIPVLGEINPTSFSLPILTIIIGALDGFNPCAMWTLLFLISLLLGMKNRRRMWILGTTFIIASASVYFLFMAAWLNLILFLGFISWVKIIIGLAALGGGAYNLKEFFTNKTGGCKVTGGEKRQRVFEKLKSITQLNSFWLALGGIILLAFAVNLVELICSAGLPAIYTQILTLNELTKWQYYLYISLYIFIFMLDDLFIFFTAMITLQMTGITTKYSRASKLIGGLLMLIIGLLLIFKPEILTLG